MKIGTHAAAAAKVAGRIKEGTTGAWAAALVAGLKDGKVVSFKDLRVAKELLRHAEDRDTHNGWDAAYRPRVAPDASTAVDEVRSQIKEQGLLLTLTATVKELFDDSPSLPFGNKTESQSRKAEADRTVKDVEKSLKDTKSRTERRKRELGGK